MKVLRVNLDIIPPEVLEEIVQFLEERNIEYEIWNLDALD